MILASRSLLLQGAHRSPIADAKLRAHRPMRRPSAISILRNFARQNQPRTPASASTWSSFTPEALETHSHGRELRGLSRRYRRESFVFRKNGSLPGKLISGGDP